MKRFILSLLTVGLISFAFGIAHATDPMANKGATPTIEERLTKNTVKGTLMKKEGLFYWIEDNDGKERKIHVDDSTKLDKVFVGDHVKAYITEDGHTTTLQRVN